MTLSFGVSCLAEVVLTMAKLLNPEVVKRGGVEGLGVEQIRAYFSVSL